jgi:predicted protein tyrosine phosphatase
MKVSAKLIDWADMIFAMEKRHKQRLIENFPKNFIDKKIFVLDIEDEYQYMDAELIEQIFKAVSLYL